ncbi:uncharacterized protein LOC6576517 isoform X2 [Drosophila mojavensis]|uniref:Uncharacterized protein, isoform C n=1 Tax=Drosophila mojavensis TaxID=7230 RepID=A0A0Q9X4H7_DROMO|nr:uncharacterized protein LOC6576517 isoform X2 [Drosophila mojavensis]KRG02982.1 uncharacterized protein Dmoj_GI17420, isoform C [Drosophila mojavensis]
MDRREADVYGGQPNLNLSHEVRIYLLSAMFALAALIQWILIGYFSDWRKYKMPQERYGFWLMATFFGICLLSCTPCGRRCPWNVMLVIIIVESSTLYIAVEQQNSRGFMVNIYAVTIVFLVVITSIFYAITMIMYTATIIHDRQSDVPKHEYIYLSVLLFFGQMILHERILAISASTTRSQACESTKAI